MYDARRPAITGASTAALTSATVVQTQQLFEPARVWRIMAYITTATVSNVSIVVTVYYRPVNGSSSGQVTLGTLTIPTAVAADKCYYKDITPYNVPAGSQIAYSVTTAAGGGGAAGSAILDVLCDFSPEVVADETKFVASA